MYRLMRSAKIKAGAPMEVVLVAQEIADYVNEKYPEQNTRVYTPVFSELGKVIWFTEVENLASAEELQGKLRADSDYVAIVSKLAGKLIEGSGRDELFQSL